MCVQGDITVYPLHMSNQGTFGEAAVEADIERRRRLMRCRNRLGGRLCTDRSHGRRSSDRRYGACQSNNFTISGTAPAMEPWPILTSKAWQHTRTWCHETQESDAEDFRTPLACGAGAPSSCARAVESMTSTAFRTRHRRRPRDASVHLRDARYGGQPSVGLEAEILSAGHTNLRKISWPLRLTYRCLTCS